ncbi:MAG: NgoFVII family restriction endonuclease [Melioribacteraceae bacterium]|nr:NgoFVII family restriction endonuclease [Melioribacteraceae bacterium]
MNSVILDNHSNGNVGDRLKSFIKPNSKLSIVSAYFTIFAYEKLKNELDSIDSLRFLFGEPKFINSLDPTKTNKRDFKIEDDGLVIPLEKKISQKAVARECKDWIQSKVEIKSIVKPNFLHGKLYHIHNPNDVSEAIMGSSNFTVNGLGLGGNSNIELNMVIPDKRDLEELINWFNNLWENSDGLVEDVKDQVIAYLEKLYVENEPEFIYFKTLYHIFHRFIEDQDKGGLLEENIGFFESQVWNMLYDFQRDGVKGAINKIMTHNGCIIADSVGLGKTFEALAVIKYFELLNKNVLVLTPKKLRENWTVYRLNDDRNPFIKDRLRYDVLNHTDLSRDRGKSGDIDLSTIKWEIYDLVVIDESHNFRNNAKGKRDDDGNLKRKSRYEKLMTEIIQAGVKTKVLLLSATPVNNNLKDLRNQIYIITGNDDSALYEKTNIKDISQTLKNAQNNFSRWADSQNENRTVKDLLERLDSSFFKLLDTLTIARSRKHILNYYDINSIGKFPERLPVISLSPNIDINKKFPSYDKLNKEIAKYRLSLFNPSAYVKDEFKDHYESKSDSAVKEFKQATREHFLIGMMKVNFLKRLESSIESFEISMDRTVNKIDSLIKRIEDYKNNHDGELSSYQPDLFIPDDEDDEELNEVKDNWLVGKKLKFELAHLKLDEWLNDLNEDKDQLNMLYNNAYSVTPERDEKLKVLKNLIKKKVNNSFNNSNKKVIIFTAFADTAYYLYDCLEDFVNKDLKIHIAVVAGGTRENKTTFKPKGFRFNSDFNSILTNFSPISKNRAKIKSMPQEGEIDILIATDCISEGQNLQDCDYLINYDIHWNPVRIIQRFGRIDRLGSINDSIQLVNFWPTDDLNNYINLKERVQARMALVDITATGEENILDPDQLKDLIEDDLKFRNKQLKRLQKEVLDLEDLDQNISLSEFTLDDFRIELTNYIEQNKKKLEEAPFGLYAVVSTPASTKKEQLDLLEKPSEQIIKPGVIFCLKQKGDTDGNEEVNPLQPYFLVYIRDDGTVRFNYTHAKQILEIFRLLCQGKTLPYEDLCNLFNEETNNGANMDFYNSLLEKAISEIVTVFGKKARAKLQSGRDGILIPTSKQASNSNNFELVTWLVIK